MAKNFLTANESETVVLAATRMSLDDGHLFGMPSMELCSELPTDGFDYSPTNWTFVRQRIRREVHRLLLVGNCFLPVSAPLPPKARGLWGAWHLTALVESYSTRLKASSFPMGKFVTFPTQCPSQPMPWRK